VENITYWNNLFLVVPVLVSVNGNLLLHLGLYIHIKEHASSNLHQVKLEVKVVVF